MLKKLIAVPFIVMMLSACGSKVEVPPAHVGKIMTKNGYQEDVIPTSKFRLDPCWAYCDRLVLLDTSDKTKVETLKIFMPGDKLEMSVKVQTTLSLNPGQTASLFGTLSPSETTDSRTSKISWDSIYNTYASQIIQTEVREYLSQYTISDVASNMDKVNADLRAMLTETISKRTPFAVRYVGLTDVKYPEIITKAQENAAERREQIQQEEAQLEISKVQLERELQETRLRRQIDLEKAQIEATSQRIQREVVDDKVLALRKLENERLWIEKWSGQLPSMVTGDSGTMLMLPSAK